MLAAKRKRVLAAQKRRVSAIHGAPQIEMSIHLQPEVVLLTQPQPVDDPFAIAFPAGVIPSFAVAVRTPSDHWTVPPHRPPATIWSSSHYCFTPVRFLIYSTKKAKAQLSRARTLMRAAKWGQSPLDIG